MLCKFQLHFFIYEKFKSFQLNFLIITSIWQSFFTHWISERVTISIIPFFFVSPASNNAVFFIILIVWLICIPSPIVQHWSISPEESIRIVFVSFCSNPEPLLRRLLTLMEVYQEPIFRIGVNGDQVSLVLIIKI